MSEAAIKTLFESYKAKVAEILNELKQITPQTVKVHVTVDDTDDCPSLTFIADGRVMDEFEFVECHPNARNIVEKLSDIICEWVRRFLYDFPEGVVITHPIHVEVEYI